MTPSSVHDIRNIALLGPAGGGKTSLLEALLAAGGEIGSAGSVERGDTVSDHDAQEKALGHSLNASLAHLEWAGHWINLVDAPGLPDLAGRALAVLPAVETAAIVISASAGVDSASRRLMAAATDKCRLIIVSKMDTAGADCAATLGEIVAAFGPECLPLNLPAADGQGVVDCFFTPDTAAATAFSSVTAAHEAIVDQVVELDEALMAAYLEQGESLTPEQLHAPFEQALREGHLVPVCFVSARSGAGVRELLDILGRLMPDPTEGNPPRFLKGEGVAATPVAVAASAEGHVLAHVFQIANDPYRGKLALFRIHQGRITPNSQLFIGDGRKPFKVAHLLRLQGRNAVETPLGVAGDLCAVARVDEIRRDAVLHDSHDEDAFHVAAPPYPQPVHGLALIARKPADEQKLAEALARLVDEDPCLEVSFDPRSRHTVVRGLGRQHLQIVLEQLASRWSLQLDTAPPAVPYRETISISAEARYRHKKQSGGAGQFGEVALRVEPLARGAGLELADEVKGGTIPTHFMPAVEKGVRQALAEGAHAGFPLQDLKVVVTDGKHHAVDSNEVSFVTAARHALIEAVRAARPQVLEPLLELTVKIADAQFGEVSAELAGRRGRLTATDSPAPGWTTLSARVPMAELDGFEARLKAICGGESEFALSAAGYEAAPTEIQDRLAQAHKGASPQH
ncbi:elongation factor G [Azoarcus indigens]|uniref:Elongation factor G n=1 Tax=Azoarcus indigens TaxID=29545 RepID=A0A4R6DXE0_9RHOO|nr:elongation factor G [Azoarcus indigens]NMG65609.1 elongation factor G [Azoarcus indigens]TDN49985.1 translation elongation factor 2 (EF-2/EF-G) [Azoarcus indigens]